MPTAMRSGSRRRSSWLPASPSLSVHYELDDLPAGACLHFARGNQPGRHGRPRPRPLLLRLGRNQARYARRRGSTCPILAASPSPTNGSISRSSLTWSQSGQPLVLPDRDGQPERRRHRRGLSIIGRHSPLARDGRRSQAAGTCRIRWSSVTASPQFTGTAERTDLLCRRRSAP